jgi:hypothetical protein
MQFIVTQPADELYTNVAEHFIAAKPQKKQPVMEKRKQRDERKEAGRRQKRRYKRNVKERASSNIQRSRLRTGYTSTTHDPKMEGVGNLLCPFCNTHLSVDHILWEFKETEDQSTNMDMKKEQRINGKTGKQE